MPKNPFHPRAGALVPAALRLADRMKGSSVVVRLAVMVLISILISHPPAEPV